jgi:Trypsin-like peptidase domain
MANDISRKQDDDVYVASAVVPLLQRTDSDRVVGRPHAGEASVDFQHVVSNDQELLTELLDRQEELKSVTDGRGGLEGLDGGTDALSGQLDRMREGTYVEGEDGGAEAIVLRFTRPVFLVQDSVVTPPADVNTFARGESAVIEARMNAAAPFLKAAIPRAGRINLANHRMDWVGTGWVVHPEIAVTNRHVAEFFAARDGSTFPFRAAGSPGRLVKASIDWRHEYARPAESVVRVEEVLWIEPDEGPDLALIRVRTTDDDGNATPGPIPLMTQADVDASVGSWVAVIGYPAQSSYNRLDDQQRIFDGIYNVKRVAPGTVMSVSPDGLLNHNATTLGGNSGSVVMDMATGQAVALHFGGFEGDRNMAVQAPVVADRLAAHT